MNKFIVVLAFLTFLLLMDEGLCRPQDMPKPPEAPSPPEAPKVPGFRRIGEGVRGHQHGANCRRAGRPTPAPTPGDDAANAAGDAANAVNDI